MPVQRIQYRRHKAFISRGDKVGTSEYSVWRGKAKGKTQKTIT